MSTHKQAVRIRAVWRAGQQRQKVFAVDDLNTPAHLTIGADVFYDLHLVCFSDGVLPGKVEVGGADRTKAEDFRFAGSSVVR